MWTSAQAPACTRYCLLTLLQTCASFRYPPNLEVGLSEFPRTFQHALVRTRGRKEYHRLYWATTTGKRRNYIPFPLVRSYLNGRKRYQECSVITIVGITTLAGGAAVLATSSIR